MNPLALLNWRVLAAAAVAAVLLLTHAKAYRMGEQSVQAQWDAERAQVMATALAVTQANRAKEKALSLSVDNVRSKYAKEIKAHAVTAVRLADGLRDLQTASDSAASPDTATACGADDDPRLCIIAQCAGSVVQLDGAVKALASQATGLQSYAADVCVAK